MSTLPGDAVILVAVARLEGAETHPDVPLYEGVSFCDAVRRAGEGELLRVLPSSIQVCRWSPVVLGLKPPQDRFERSLAPRIPHPVFGYLLGPPGGFPAIPEVVIVRGEVGAIRRMLAAAGPEDVWDGHARRLDRSALAALTAEEASLRRRAIDVVNRVLAPLSRWKRWQAFTRYLFRSGWVTARFDALISRTLADMSICRNSTVIPLLTGRVNASFFCTGGITWGRNRPDHLTSGWPWPIYRRVLQRLEGEDEPETGPRAL